MKKLPPLLFLLLVGCDHGFVDPSRASSPAPAADAPLHPEEVHLPSTLGVVDTPLVDIHGTPIGAACATCHSGSEKDRIERGSGAPEAFHTGVSLSHGELSCNHCHDADDRTKLRLADGSAVKMTEALVLCAQCHGPQYRDYKHGAHGGMAGHWDRKQGGRDRNHCVDCHAPHTPAFEGMVPVPAPQDRFFAEGDAHD